MRLSVFRWSEAGAESVRGEPSERGGGLTATLGMFLSIVGGGRRGGGGRGGEGRREGKGGRAEDALAPSQPREKRPPRRRPAESEFPPFARPPAGLRLAAAAQPSSSSSPSVRPAAHALSPPLPRPLPTLSLAAPGTDARHLPPVPGVLVAACVHLARPSSAPRTIGADAPPSPTPPQRPVLPAVAQSTVSLRPLSTTAPAALHESLPLDPLPSASSSAPAASPAAVVLTASSEPPSDEDSTPLAFGLEHASALSPTAWPTADTLLSPPSSSSSESDRAVALLNSEPRKYILTALHRQRYVLHPRDILTVAHIKPTLAPGTKLALTRIFEVGSHAFRLRAGAGDRLTGVRCEATVLENTTGPLTIKRLVKRRKGYKKEIRSKMRYTRLRIGEIAVEAAETAADLAPAPRKLDRPVSQPFDQYSPTDQSIRARLARQFGVVDFAEHQGAGRARE